MEIIKTSRYSVNGMVVECLEAGDGPLVILLHGFPDYPGTWRDLVRRLASFGYRAIAPFMRGFSPTTKAPDGNYKDWATGSDALLLIETLGYQKGIIIGHDWGAAAAYAAARIAPERVAKLVTLAVPAGDGLRRALVNDGDQQRRSWYWFFFQMHFAAEAIVFNDFAFIDRLWKEWSPGFALSDNDLRALKSCFQKDGVVDEVLRYYRQLFVPPPVSAPPLVEARLRNRIAVPTLYLHGVDDGCIGPDTGNDAADCFSAFYRRELISGAGHFLHLEQCEKVSDSIMKFLMSST